MGFPSSVWQLTWGFGKGVGGLYAAWWYSLMRPPRMSALLDWSHARFYGRRDLAAVRWAEVRPMYRLMKPHTHLRKVSTEYEDNFNTHRPRRALNQSARCDRYPTRSKPTSKSFDETGSMAS